MTNDYTGHVPATDQPPQMYQDLINTAIDHENEPRDPAHRGFYATTPPPVVSVEMMEQANLDLGRAVAPAPAPIGDDSLDRVVSYLSVRSGKFVLSSPFPGNDHWRAEIVPDDNELPTWVGGVGARADLAIDNLLLSTEGADPLPNPADNLRAQLCAILDLAPDEPDEALVQEVRIRLEKLAGVRKRAVELVDEMRATVEGVDALLRILDR